MTLRNVYNVALALIGEVAHLSNTDDYEARAPYLLVTVAERFAALSEKISGVKAEVITENTLDTEFPLDRSLFAAASLALGSLLIIDELPELSEALEKRAERAAKIAADAVCTVTSTKEVYPG